jgi:hypothetical protein
MNLVQKSQVHRLNHQLCQPEPLHPALIDRPVYPLQTSTTNTCHSHHHLMLHTLPKAPVVEPIALTLSLTPLRHLTANGQLITWSLARRPVAQHQLYSLYTKDKLCLTALDGTTVTTSLRGQLLLPLLQLHTLSHRSHVNSIQMKMVAAVFQEQARLKPSTYPLRLTAELVVFS